MQETKNQIFFRQTTDFYDKLLDLPVNACGRKSDGNFCQSFGDSYICGYVYATMITLFKKYRILRHMGYWTAFIGFFAIMQGVRYGEFAQAFTREISILPGRLLAVYFILYYLIPRYLPQHRYGIFILFSVLTLILAGIIQRVFFHLIYYPLFVPPNIASPLWDFFRIMDEVMSINTALIVPLTYKLMKYWQEDRNRAQMLAKEKLESELQALKNQVNPHFLFNTLNNIYGLALKKSSQVPDVILKLSGMLSYILYESDAQQVSLQKEVALMDDYLDLQKLRSGNELKVSFDKNGIHSTNFTIAPLLFLPLLENCFKHGVNKQTNAQHLNISLTVLQDKLIFRTENTIPKAQSSDTSKNGIGLVNLQKRLQLIYPNKHSLTITENHTFVVELEIQLN